MSNNTDTVLTQLAAEVNELEAQRTAGNQGKQIEMGHKLIAIRQILREVNGVGVFGAGPDGYTPVGWHLWITENLSLSKSQVVKCIRLAADPGYIQTVRTYDLAHAYRPKAALARARKGWPVWTPEQREQFSAGVLQLLNTP